MRRQLLSCVHQATPTCLHSCSLGLNVLLFLRLGHTPESLHRELVLSTALRSPLSIQNLLATSTLPASLSLLFKFYCHPYHFGFFDLVHVSSLDQYFWLYPRPTTQFLYSCPLWFLVNAWVLFCFNWLDTNSFNKPSGDTYQASLHQPVLSQQCLEGPVSLISV